MEDGIEETLTYCDFPSEHWTRIRTNNVIERLNREIRRRTRVVGSFPDGNSALMLVCARLRHVAGTQWGNKKYMNMKHLEAALRTPPLLADFTHARPCKPFCEKSLTLPRKRCVEECAGIRGLAHIANFTIDVGPTPVAYGLATWLRNGYMGGGGADLLFQPARPRVCGGGLRLCGVHRPCLCVLPLIRLIPVSGNFFQEAGTIAVINGVGIRRGRCAVHCPPHRLFPYGAGLFLCVQRGVGAGETAGVPFDPAAQPESGICPAEPSCGGRRGICRALHPVCKGERSVWVPAGGVCVLAGPSGIR